MSEKHQLITDQVRSYIGTESKPLTAWAKVTSTEIRRFMQSIPDEDPIYWDEEYARASKFGGIVAPPTLPQVIVGMRPPGSPDMLLDMPDDWGGDNPTADGDPMEVGWYPGLGEMIDQFPKNMVFFHGGDDLRIYQLAALGDQVTCTSKVVDMYEKPGRSGQLGFVVIDFTYVNQKGEVLCVNRHTEVLRESAEEA